jgi:eukaryotic-like serine/threonine-protein kinase
MTLNSRTKLGPYEITGALGAGGMGEVYRARDTRLGRDVALKVLPEAFARDAERLARFRREAQVLASLNHPNIAAIYGFEDSGATHALVMELVEGPTLAERIKSSAIAMDEALPMAKQICEAMEYAHERGIIHRDLKPSNVKVTAEGNVKVLDFGLAKAIEGDASAASVENSPTLSAVATRAGFLLGTAAYMSPEQARGKNADRRSDIWAFGVMLFEMLSGKRLFTGDTTSDTLAEVLKMEPEWKALPENTPLRIRELVQRCLKKDPRQRLQSIGDARIVIEETLAGGTETGAFAAPIGTRRKTGELVLAAAAAVAAIAAAVLAVLYFMRGPGETRAIRADIKPAANTALTNYNGGTGGFAVSPDGMRVTYVAERPDGRSVLWVRSLDSLQAQPLEGTEGANEPFWSPDSQFIGFFADGKLKKIEATGGPLLTLADAPRGRGGTWNRDGVILFVPLFNTPVFRISAAGGVATQVTTLNRDNNESSHRWPYFLPDGRHFLYLGGTPFTPVGSPTNSIMVGSLDSKETKFLFHNNSNAIFASGHLLFVRQNTLMAQAFDSKRLELTGEAVPIAEGVEEVATRVQGSFSASDNGTLAYLEMGSYSHQLIWLDRSGKQVGVVPGADSYTDPHISPDGRELAYVLESPSTDLWLYDIARGIKTRFTFGSGNEAPVWSRDGSRIAYTSVRNGNFGIYEKSADGSGHEEVLVKPGPDQIYPLDWSPDGKYLAYLYWQFGGTTQVWILPLQGEHKPHAYNLTQQSSSPTYQAIAHFSPDGKWLAYSSGESGTLEVYVTPFPGPGGKWQVSTDGGWFPQWRRDGKELFYMSLDNKVMSAEVRENGQSFVIGAVKPLFQTRPYLGIFIASLFDVTGDGQRFIVPYDTGQANRTISLVVNWTALLKKQ